MPAFANFENFYTSTVEPRLGRISLLRSRMQNWQWGIVISLIFTVLNFWGCQKNVEDRQMYGWMAAIGFILLAVSVQQFALNRDRYINDFKETIIRDILSFLLPGVTYKPSGYIASKSYRRSNLYRQRYDSFDGNDYIEGTYKNVHFHCSELHTTYHKVNNVEGTIFKGLFFSAAVNSFFKAGTYIWSKGCEQAGSQEEYHHYLPMPAVSRLRTGSEIFDKYFSAFSTNPHESAYILTAEMMDLLVRFRRQIKKNISLSVVTGRCYVAIPLDDDLFEPSLNNPGDKEIVKGYFFSALLILSIINQLQLSRLT